VSSLLVPSYEIFELEFDSPLSEIRKQFFALARRFHPDRCRDGKEREYNEVMAVINNAWERVKDWAKDGIPDEQRMILVRQRQRTQKMRFERKRTRK